jgi:branched-chain amino acid transport system ATP-binding protein
MNIDAPLLDVRDLQAFYGDSHVLQGLTFRINEGEIVTLLGRNGAGKTTTLKAIIGMIAKRTGSIALRGRELICMKSYLIARLGVGFCPEERGIFASLTVKENLLLPPVVQPGGLSTADVLAMFPILHERRNAPGTKLSGGEQQMLAIGRLLRSGARLLLLDEPTEGLAPVIVDRIGKVLSDLKALGFTILLVEQNVKFASAIADRHYIVEDGRIIDEFRKSDIERNLEKLASYLGI